MRYYVDCEFDGHNGPLLSIALVTDGTYSIHIQTDAQPADPWVQENVMPIMDRHSAPVSLVNVPINGVGPAIRAFIASDQMPTIVADSPVDIARFCRAISTGFTGEWASTEYPAMRFEVHNVDCWPNALDGGVQHNAWWDAMALRHKLIERGEV